MFRRDTCIPRLVTVTNPILNFVLVPRDGTGPKMDLARKLTLAH